MNDLETVALIVLTLIIFGFLLWFIPEAFFEGGFYGTQM